MNKQNRYAHYNHDYYIGRACPESQSYDKHILRPEDMGAAFCYALGYTSYEQVAQALRIPPDAPRWIDSPLDFAEQVYIVPAWIKQPRWPRLVLNVGCGRGELDAAFYRLGVPCVGIDPSPAVRKIYENTVREWGKADYSAFIGAGFAHAAQFFRPMMIDTAIFCESLEHIPRAEFEEGWRTLMPLLNRNNGLLIITNWLNYHPILPDDTGYDHVTLVDDAYYDWLAGQARQTVFRRGSHLVLQF